MANNSNVYSKKSGNPAYENMPGNTNSHGKNMT
jgi:hypothetical protein